jgi:hypothetical protein
LTFNRKNAHALRGKSISLAGRYGARGQEPGTRVNAAAWQRIEGRFARMTIFTRVLSFSAIFMCAATIVQSAGTVPVHCTLNKPLSCPNIGYLHWASGFAGAVTQFIGAGKASYFRRNGKLSSQALFGLSGPPDERKAMPGDLFLFSACPAHQCFGQAAAVVLDKNGIIKAIGFSSFHCAERCDFEHRYLDFYVDRGHNSDSINSALLSWGTGSTIRVLLEDPHVDDGIEARTATHLMR